MALPSPPRLDAYPRALHFPYADRTTDPCYVPPWGPPSPHLPAASVHDGRGRQKAFIETSTQRRTRVEFIHRREWTRRIADWVNQSNPGVHQPTYPWDHLLPRYDVDDDASASASVPDSCTYTLDEGDPPEEEEEPEPYIIYTASPRPLARRDTPSAPVSPASPSAYPFPLAPSFPLASSAPPFLPASAPAHHRRRRAGIPRSRHSSLSSISEEDELAHAHAHGRRSF